VLAIAQRGDDVTEVSTSVGGTAGNGVSTFEDLAIWAAADFGNVLLSNAAREARLAGKPADSIMPTSEHGLGLQLAGDWHGHGGATYGWGSSIPADPTTAEAVVVNANACCGLAPTNLLPLAASFPDDAAMANLVAKLAGS
jgi:hypothetical protein